MSIRVLIVDDQKFIRQALQSLLANHPLIEVVGEAADGELAIIEAEKLRPDVVLMDIIMPNLNGVEATKKIRQHFENISVLVLSIDDDDVSVIHALQNGAAGYVLRNHLSAEELSLAIQAVYHNNIYLSPEIGKILISQLSTKQYTLPRNWSNLTSREQQIAHLVANGATNLEIAQTLYIAEKTVKNHISNILTRLNLRNRIQLALLVNRHLINPISMN